MAKFDVANPDDDASVLKPAMDQIPAATKGAAVAIPTMYNSNSPGFSIPSPFSTSSSPQLSPEAQLAKIELETKQWEKEFGKQEEHWMKTYWRPGMAWLYMIICFVDFVVFPVVAMFLPIMTKLPYVPWQSLSLSNGGLIHMAFGAILGISAYGRTQEKVATRQY